MTPARSTHTRSSSDSCSDSANGILNSSPHSGTSPPTPPTPDDPPHVRRMLNHLEPAPKLIEGRRRANNYALEILSTRIQQDPTINQDEAICIKVLFNFLEESFQYNRIQISRQWHAGYKPNWDETWAEIHPLNQAYLARIARAREAVGLLAEKDMVDQFLAVAVSVQESYEEDGDADWSEQYQKIRRGIAIIEAAEASTTPPTAVEMPLDKTSRAAIINLFEIWDGNLASLDPNPTKAAMQAAVPYNWAEILTIHQQKVAALPKPDDGIPGPPKDIEEIAAELKAEGWKAGATLGTRGKGAQSKILGGESGPKLVGSARIGNLVETRGRKRRIQTAKSAYEVARESHWKKVRQANVRQADERKGSGEAGSSKSASDKGKKVSPRGKRSPNKGKGRA